MTLVLASTSATRAKLLADAGVPFETAHPPPGEAALRAQLQEANRSPVHIARMLAAAKAQGVSHKMPGRLILGADQILDLDGQILAKAGDLEEAQAQLRALRGRSHDLISAAVLICDGKLLAEPCARVRLTMRNFSDGFLAGYVRAEGHNLLGSVGCYRLEGIGAQLFSAIDGDYFSVLGLPLLAVLESLRELGMLAS